MEKLNSLSLLLSWNQISNYSSSRNKRLKLSQLRKNKRPKKKKNSQSYLSKNAARQSLLPRVRSAKKSSLKPTRKLLIVAVSLWKSGMKHSQTTMPKRLTECPREKREQDKLVSGKRSKRTWPLKKSKQWRKLSQNGSAVHLSFSQMTRKNKSRRREEYLEKLKEL